jgi:hypothetical protein
LIIFSDGSTAMVNEGEWRLIQSFNLGNNRCYSLLKSDDPAADAKNDVTCNVTPGSKFEVITPSAIAGVGGTEFRVVVKAGAVANTVETTVSVTSGTVNFSDRPGKRKREVKETEEETYEAQVNPANRGRALGLNISSEDHTRDRGRGQGH